jgi:two-component system NtrC family sensor kinase
MLLSCIPRTNGMFPKSYKDIRLIFRYFRYRFHTPLFKRLSTRLLLTLTLLAAMPLIIVGLFMTSVTQETLSEYVKSQHSEIARRARNEINLFLETPVTVLKILLETQDLNEMNPFAQNLILNKVKSAQHEFNRIFTVDLFGNEVTTTSFGDHPVTYQNEPFYRQAMNGNSFFSPVYFNEAKEPFVITSQPIRRYDRIVGVLAGEIDLKSIWNLVDEIKIGESGTAFVISSSGQLIAHPDKKKVLQGTKVIDNDLISEALNSVEQTRIFKSPEGVEMLGTFAHVSQFDWLIVIQQPIKEAYAVANKMLFQVFVFVALVILLAMLIAYLLEKRITAPINTLINGVKQYAAGDLNFRIRIDKYEEIAVLAKEFNAMARRLLENQKKLRSMERLAAMSRFATLVSHEIRNPLNSMNINLQILKREIENPQANLIKVHKYYDIILSEIQRMDNLVKNFLMISRPPRVDFLPDDLHEILDEVLLMYAINAEQQKIQIVKQYVNKKILANVDRDQLKQVFHNVLINALQAMPNGGTLTVRTSIGKIKNLLKQTVNALRIEFIDTGVGISKEKLHGIFEFYYTSKKSGTGLGLSIAKQIVEGHFGSIYAWSKEGKGTRLIINLPVKTDGNGSMVSIKD